MSVTDQTVPTITCPDWCAVEQQDHEAELPAWEGYVMHRGCAYSTGAKWVEVHAFARPDGTLDKSESPQVCVESHPGEGLSARDAQVFADSILKAAGWVRELNASGGTSS